MKHTDRRWLAILGSSVTGLGIGLGIAQLLRNVSRFVTQYQSFNNPLPSLGGPLVVVAGLIVGLGIGVFIAAFMREAPRSHQQ